MSFYIFVSTIPGIVWPGYYKEYSFFNIQKNSVANQQKLYSSLQTLMDRLASFACDFDTPVMADLEQKTPLYQRKLEPPISHIVSSPKEGRRASW